MRAIAAWVISACLVGAAAGQPPAAPASSPATPDELVQEFKGLAAARPRSGEALRADVERLLRHLLARMNDRNRGSYARVEARSDLEAVCLRAGRPGAEPERLAFCQAMAAVLAGESADASRTLLVQMMEHVGRGECVPPLAKMLLDKDGQTREQARRALMANPAPEAAEEIRKALISAVGTPWRVALVNALGYRRDTGALEWLGKLLKDDDRAVAVAAAAALGKIGTQAAIAALNDSRVPALEPVRSAIADGLFSCAEQALASGDAATAMGIYRKSFENPTEPRRSRIVALRHLVAAQGEKAVPLLVGLLNGEDAVILSAALELAKEIPGEAATRAIASLLPKARTVQRTVELLELLGARADPAAREAVLEAMAGRDLGPADRQTVRLAGIKALGGAGNEQDVMLLLKLAAQALKGKEEEQKLARASLRQLRGARVNQVLIRAIGEGDPGVRVEAVRALGARNALEATTALLNLVGDADAAVRMAALEALGQLADLTAVGPLVKWLVTAKEGSETYMAERAIGMACERMEDRDAAADVIVAAMRGASVPARCALMRVCGRLGGSSALDALAKGAEDGDEKVREAAVRAMAQSPDMEAAQTLLKLARTAPSEENRALALRGYIRLVQYIEQPYEKKIWTFIQILDLATRPEDKKLAIAGLGDIKTLGAMKLAEEYLDSKDLRPEAEAAVVRIARHIYESNPKDVIQALQRVLRGSANPETITEAKRILALAQQADKSAPKKP